MRACAGRRGTKRKAEAEAAKVVEEKPSAAEEKVEAAGEMESGQEGQRVVIEHWYVVSNDSYSQHLNKRQTFGIFKLFGLSSSTHTYLIAPINPCALF